MSENTFTGSFQVPVLCLGHILCRAAMSLLQNSGPTIPPFLSSVLCPQQCSVLVFGFRAQLISALLLKFCAHCYIDEFTKPNTTVLGFSFLSAAYLLPLLSVLPAACPDLPSSSSLGRCYCRCPAQRTSVWSGACCVPFLC